MVEQISLDLDKRLTGKRGIILKLAAQHGAYDVRVFGSTVRGDAKANSDIDFLVRWDISRISSWGGVGLKLELEALLGCQVDVVDEAGLHPLIKEQVLQEAVAL